MQQTTVPLQPPPQRKRSLPPALRIDPHPQQPQVDLVVENDAPVLDGPVVAAPPLTKPRSLRNMKGLALALPPTNSRPASPPVPPTPSVATQQQRRRPSIVSLPPATASTSAMAFRANEGDSPSAPYLDGPIEIMPKIWLGAEDNARDWPKLIERGIRSVLNVAKEVTEPFGSSTEQQPLRPFQSTPNLQKTTNSAPDATSTYIPAHRPSGRPGMHYLKLPWSHGQADLVGEGFVAAMAFVDQSLERGDGVLIHCQCGVSRSATLVIALVMRAAAHATNDTPADIAALKGQGMHSAYAYVKEKSKYIGPNMSLMYQLLEYEGALNRASGASPSVSDRSSAIAEEEEEWERRRRELDELDSPEDKERESLELMKEAQALDRQMEERIVARKDSIISSGASTLSSHSHGMGGPWKSRFAGGYGRTRTGSIGSNYTARSSISLLSEELVEEEEEGVVADGLRTPSTAATDEDAHLFTFAKETDPSRRPPPSAPPTKQSFNFPSRPPQKKENRRRPPPLAPVPSSPLDPPPPPPQEPSPPVQAPTRRRAAPPPLKLALPPVPPSAVIEPIQSPSFKSRTSASTSRRSSHNSAKRIPFSPREAPLQTPSQTLFVFPPEPSNIRTPSTMMLTSLAMPSPTPRGAAFKREGRRSWLSFGIPPTPTTAFSIVDAKGWVGVGS